MICKVKAIMDYKDGLLIDEDDIIYMRHPTDPRISRIIKIGKREKELKQMRL